MSTPLTADDLRARKGGRRLAMLTAYDYPTAMALDAAGLDILLVGDSIGEVELGYGTTRAVSLEMMAHHVRAVRNGAPAPTSAGTSGGDLPHARGGRRERAAARGGGRRLGEARGRPDPQVAAIIADGIPVMGHVGLLPQTAVVYQPRGHDPGRGRPHRAEACALDAAGCYAIVIEAVPAELATRITAEVACPTIGIAAGPECDGQVLVSTDLIGQLPDTPRGS